ncbi:UNVERIFIED_ORG: hypothetical protein GGE53_004753 [Rhizobium etli]
MLALDAPMAAPHPNPLPVNGARGRAPREVSGERRGGDLSPSPRKRGSAGRVEPRGSTPVGGGSRMRGTAISSRMPPSRQRHGAPSLHPHPEVRSPQGEASKDGAGHRSHPPSSFEAPCGAPQDEGWSLCLSPASLFAVCRGRPPLPCRASPPQVGRLAGSAGFPKQPTLQRAGTVEGCEVRSLSHL